MTDYDKHKAFTILDNRSESFKYFPELGWQDYYILHKDLANALQKRDFSFTQSDKFDKLFESIKFLYYEIGDINLYYNEGVYSFKLYNPKVYLVTQKLYYHSVIPIIKDETDKFLMNAIQAC